RPISQRIAPLVREEGSSPPYAVLTPVSRRYPPLEGRWSTCYSTVRHYPSPEGPGPFDLHTLGTPLAFVLSQDQTLHESSWPARLPRSCLRKNRPGKGSGVCPS